MRVHYEPENEAVMGTNKWPILVVVISQCIISPIVLHRHETLFLTPRKEHKLHVVF